MLCVFDTIFTLRTLYCARGVKIVFFIQTIFTLRIDSVPFSFILKDYFYTSKNL